MIRHLTTFSAKLLLVVTSVVLLVGFVAAYAIYRVAAQRQFHRTQQELMAIAKTTASLVDGDQFDSLRDPAQMSSPEYRAIQRTLLLVQQANDNVRFVYTMRRDAAGRLLFVVDTPATDYNRNGRIDTDEEMAELGRVYDVVTPALLQGLERPAVEEEASRDQWGVTLSGYAPVLNRAGQRVGLVGVDMTASRLDEMAGDFRLQCLAAAVAVLVAAVLMALLVSWHIGRPLKNLLGGIRTVRDGSLDVKLPTDYPSQEFRELSETFNQMIEKRKELEELLQQSAKMEVVGQLASGVAHDFNNHLTPIVGYSDLLMRELPADSEAAEFAQTINRSAQRASALVRQLLSFSRREETRSESVDVHQVILEVVQLLGRTFERQHELATELNATRVVVLGDPRHFENALLNLALNARDAMPNGGKLVIVTETVQGAADGLDRLRVTVRDTGIGMDEATRRKLFRPFFTTKEHGTGLGLITVSRLVERQGAVIRVESEPGKGSAFIMDFPCAPEASPSVSGAAT